MRQITQDKTRGESPKRLIFTMNNIISFADYQDACDK